MSQLERRRDLAGVALLVGIGPFNGIVGCIAVDRPVFGAPNIEGYLRTAFCLGDG